MSGPAVVVHIRDDIAEVVLDQAERGIYSTTAFAATCAMWPICAARTTGCGPY
ncbi:hypothetical protein BH10PSE12_BH10PSE12_37110 [soil metagenome]